MNINIGIISTRHILVLLFGFILSGCSTPPSKPYEQDVFLSLWTDALKNPSLFAENTPAKLGHIKFIIYPNDAQVFSKPSLLAIESLTNQTWNLPYPTRVDSITNFERMKFDGDDFVLYPAIEDATILSNQDRVELQEFVKSEPFLAKRLYFSSQEISVVEVYFDVSENNAQSRIPAIVSKSILLKKRIESQFPVKLQLAGDYMNVSLKSLKKKQFELSSGQHFGIYEPNYLLQLDAFTTWLKEQPEVDSVVSISDLLKKLNRVFKHPENTWHEATNNKNPQYLLLYKMSLSYGKDVDHLYNNDYSSAILHITLSDQALKQPMLIESKVDKWLALNAKDLKLVSNN